MVRRTGDTPIRLASKSVRCRSLQNRVLAVDGYRGVLAFTMPEALWLAEEVEDVLVGYPTANRAALRTLTDDPRLAARVAVMVDSPEHLAFVAEATGGAPVRVCLDLDASLHLLGDRVWFRHPKAGEVCEHVNERRLVRGGEVVDVVPTYRGEGRAFL